MREVYKDREKKTRQGRKQEDSERGKRKKRRTEREGTRERETREKMQKEREREIVCKSRNLLYLVTLLPNLLRPQI